MVQTITQKLTENEIWLQWFRDRVNQYIERCGLTREQALNQLRSIPSFDDRTEFINQHVDDQYKIVLKAKKRAA